MKKTILTAACLAALSLFTADAGLPLGNATGGASYSGGGAAEGKKVIVGTVITSRDRHGKVLAAVLKVGNVALEIPSGSIPSFEPYDGKSVQACCAVNGNMITPLCVVGVEKKAAKIPGGRFKV